ncbi:MAG: serine/threonine-protein kinase [Gemmataceae bacterium]
MPAPATVDEFLDVVRKSGLVPADRLDETSERLSPAATPDQVAAALIRAGLLTRFQAKQLKHGRYKRFEIAGKYRLLELLGVGGMGAVYLCEHQLMKRLVAVKVLPVEKLKDPSALPRFQREARAVAALDDPNIVRAYDIDKYDGLHFLVMEYVDGASLQEVVSRHGPLSPDRAAQYVWQCANGLQHAHELGMVHRDIKPGNLLLDRSGVVKILDMGLARFFDQTSDNLTERFDNNCVLGTADYLAPEQAISNVVDIRADIYALGGSLYFLLTGRSPFPDGTIPQKLVAHQTKEPRPVTEFRSDVPVELLAVLHKMIRKDPAERYQTPRELADALAPWADVTAVPPAQEMPDLCPAVLALVGPGAEKSRPAGGRTARAGGRTVGQGSSVVLSPSAPSSPSPSDVVTQAQVPTARSETTAPLRDVPTRGGEVGAKSPYAATAAAQQRRVLLLGVAVGLGSAVALAGLSAAVWWLVR